MRLGSCFAAAIAVTGGQCAALGTPPSYELIVLSVPGMTGGGARDLNSAGDVVGSVLTPAGERAFVAAGGVVTVLPSLPDTVRSAATGISDTGVIVGWSLPPGSFSPKAVRWASSTAQPELLGTLGGADSSAEAISPDGLTVAGWGRPAPGVGYAVEVGFQAFVRGGADNEAAGTLAIGSWSTIADIDNGGRAVGSGGTQDGRTSALLFDPDEGAVELPDLGGLSAQATAIASTGDAVGIAGTGKVVNAWETERAVVWSGHAVRALEPLPGFETSWGSGMNADGWVVGDSVRRPATGPWVFQPTLWIDGVAHDLRSLVVGSSPTVLGVERINGDGWIAGSARVGSMTVPCVLRPLLPGSKEVE